MSKQKSGSRFAGLFKAGAAEETAESGETPATTPKGKRSNKDFTQVTAYLRKNTHKRVKSALILDDQAGDFSDLVEQLLQEWLARREP